MRLLTLAFALLFATVTPAQAESVLAKAGLADHQWKTGQVVAISELIHDSSTFFFEAATGSRFGHIGVVVVNDGKAAIYHSDPLLKGAGIDTIEKFIARSEDVTGRFNFVVLDAQLDEARAKLVAKRAAAFVKKKVPYNFGQVYLNDGSKLNCSEFVYRVLDGQAGEIQTVSEAIDMNALNGGLVKLGEMTGGGPSPKASDRIVTPLSIVKSPALKVVKTTLHLANPLSDAEIFKAWDEGGGFKAMIAGFAARFTGASDVLAYMRTLEADPAAKADLESQTAFIKTLLLSGGPLALKPAKPFPASFRQD